MIEIVRNSRKQMRINGQVILDDQYDSCPVAPAMIYIMKRLAHQRNGNAISIYLSIMQVWLLSKLWNLMQVISLGYVYAVHHYKSSSAGQ